MTLIGRLKLKAAAYTCEIHALYFAYRDPRTPWHAKAVTALIVAYALSPVDLIPDFIPIVGYLDDLILLPLGIMLAIRMIPVEVLNDSRARAREKIAARLPRSRTGLLIIAVLWLIGLAVAGVIIVRTLHS